MTIQEFVCLAVRTVPVLNLVAVSQLKKNTVSASISNDITAINDEITAAYFLIFFGFYSCMVYFILYQLILNPPPPSLDFQGLLYHSHFCILVIIWVCCMYYWIIFYNLGLIVSLIVLQALKI